MINRKDIIDDARRIVSYLCGDESISFSLINKCELECLKKVNKQDLDFFYESDPAADSKDEIKLTYPGYKAILLYRLAHILYKKNQKLEARIITEYGHSRTGIDIHPGAEISSPFFIDHGTGVVIGETTIIGKNVRIYQGVTLGALSPALGQSIKGVKRHPTIKDNVTIYAGATLLGDISIGNNVVIGGGVFITQDIPDNSKVTSPKPILCIDSKID